MIIGIDVDDTLADTSKYLLNRAIEFNKNVLNNSEIDYSKGFPKCFGWGQRELSMFYNEIFDKEVLNIPMKKDASKYVKMLKEVGHKIVIITARDFTELTHPYEDTKKWLEKNNIPFDKLIVSARYKGPFVNNENVSVFVDDSIGQCTHVKDYTNADVIMFAKPTNDIKYKGITRLTSWKEVYNYIINMKK